MKRFHLFALACSVVLFCAFCPTSLSAPAGVNPEAREHVSVERNVGRFTALESQGSIPVTYIQSDYSLVLVEGSPEYMESLITEVRGNVLHIGMKKGRYRNLNLAVTVFSPVLDAAAAVGAFVLFVVLFRPESLTELRLFLEGVLLRFLAFWRLFLLLAVIIVMLLVCVPVFRSRRHSLL